LVPKVPGILKLGSVFIDMFHGVFLGLLLDFQPTDASRTDEHYTHYGPPNLDKHPGANYTPGRKLLFQVGVIMVARVPDDVVQCGRLAGVTFPAPGPVAHVPIHWSPFLDSLAGIGSGGSQYSLLKKRGTIELQDDETNADGYASLVVVPNDEEQDDEDRLGHLRHLDTEDGVVTPTADLLSPFGNTIANLNEVVLPKLLFIPFGFEWHEQVPLRVLFEAQSIHSAFGSSSSRGYADLYEETPPFAKSNLPSQVRSIPDLRAFLGALNVTNWRVDWLAAGIPYVCAQPGMDAGQRERCLDIIRHPFPDVPALPLCAGQTLTGGGPPHAVDLPESNADNGANQMWAYRAGNQIHLGILHTIRLVCAAEHFGCFPCGLPWEIWDSRYRDPRRVPDEEVWNDEVVLEAKPEASVTVTRTFPIRGRFDGSPLSEDNVITTTLTLTLADPSKDPN